MLLEMSFAPTFSQFPGSNDNFSTGEHAVESVIIGVEDSPNLAAGSSLRKNKGTACDAYAFILVIIGKEEKDEDEVENVAITASVVAKSTAKIVKNARFAWRWTGSVPTLILDENDDDDDDNKGVVSIVFSPNGESPNMVNAQILCKTKRERERFKSIDFLVARVRERARFALRNSFFFFPVLFFLKGSLGFIVLRVAQTVVAPLSSSSSHQTRSGGGEGGALETRHPMRRGDPGAI